MSWRLSDKVALGAVVPSTTITVDVMCVHFEEQHDREAEWERPQASVVQQHSSCNNN